MANRERPASCQFLVNQASGELAEEASEAFRRLGLAKVHQLLDEVFSFV